jgi:hypothetical protein
MADRYQIVLSVQIVYLTQPTKLIFRVLWWKREFPVRRAIERGTAFLLVVVRVFQP